MGLISASIHFHLPELGHKNRQISLSEDLLMDVTHSSNHSAPPPLNLIRFCHSDEYSEYFSNITNLFQPSNATSVFWMLMSQTFLLQYWSWLIIDFCSHALLNFTSSTYNVYKCLIWWSILHYSIHWSLSISCDQLCQHHLINLIIPPASPCNKANVCATLCSKSLNLRHSLSRLAERLPHQGLTL